MYGPTAYNNGTNLPDDAQAKQRQSSIQQEEASLDKGLSGLTMPSAKATSRSLDTSNSFESNIYTGDNGTIGYNINGQYHIDSKVRILDPENGRYGPETLAAARYAFDEMAKGYAAEGRDIEFSNSDVDGVRWDVNDSIEVKNEKLIEVAKAHGSQHDEWLSFDYYPIMAQSAGRNSPGSDIAGVEMILPSTPGGHVSYSNEGAENVPGYYGIKASIYREGESRPWFITGHGDVNRGVPPSRSF